MSDRRRILLIGLDGYDPGLAKTLLAEGKMPNLARLIAESARADLDHGEHRLTGLSWEHFATGLTPDALGRWSAVSFDPSSYRVRQPTSTAPPFLAAMEDGVVVFDPPYFDLDLAPSALGVVNWGAHDPGVVAKSRPSTLHSEILERFGPYPASSFIYGFVWPSQSRTMAAADALTRALKMRTEICRWLFAERLPEWKIAYVVVGELHSVIEPMWHGVDETHPLHGHPTATSAANGIRSVYFALDDLIGTLRETFPDAVLAAFCMHGMGANNADVASMLLLPEFCYRRALGRPLFSATTAWTEAFKASCRPPYLDEKTAWEGAVRRCMNMPLGLRLRARMRKTLRKLPGGRTLVEMLKSPEASGVDPSHREGADEVSLDWMPATSYAPFWPAMDAFALPSFYDGRIRINLEGRERLGRVRLGDYHRFREALEADLLALRDPSTAQPAVRDLRHQQRNDPLELHDTEPDIQVIWEQAVIMALQSATLGTIGPAPIRRTGGHTGGDGVFYLLNGPLEAGYHGRRSAFDVAPTTAELLGDPHVDRLSGRSMLAAIPAR